jgi:hypothetical protein
MTWHYLNKLKSLLQRGKSLGMKINKQTYNSGARGWLRHYATSRKVAGSIPDEVAGFFNWPNPSSRTMAPGSTQPLTEMSTRNLPGGKGRPARKAVYAHCEVASRGKTNKMDTCLAPALASYGGSRGASHCQSVFWRAQRWLAASCSLWLDCRACFSSKWTTKSVNF